MQTDRTCLIISGGDFSPFPSEMPVLDYVIACDRGYEYAQRLGLIPDVIIGDFDSSPQPDTEIPVHVHPVRKDDTDTMLAVRHALEKGFRQILICCALGGRLDHAFANIQSLAFAAQAGAVARIVSEDTCITVFSGGCMTFPRREGRSFSCFALSDTCTGVSIQGAEFACNGLDISNRFPIGVSNVWREDEIRVSCDTGILAVIESKLRSGEHI